MATHSGPSALTASGRAMLAALTGAHVRALYPEPDAFVTRHEVGPRSLSALRRILVETRRRGHAIEDGEVTPGLVSVAVAVLDSASYPVASVTLTFPDYSAAEEQTVLVAEVNRTARAVAHRIGGQLHSASE